MKLEVHESERQLNKRFTIMHFLSLHTSMHSQEHQGKKTLSIEPVCYTKNKGQLEDDFK